MPECSNFDPFLCFLSRIIFGRGLFCRLWLSRFRNRFVASPRGILKSRGGLLVQLHVCFETRAVLDLVHLHVEHGLLCEDVVQAPVDDRPILSSSSDRGSAARRGQSIMCQVD